jgi:hypothetical protein
MTVTALATYADGSPVLTVRSTRVELKDPGDHGVLRGVLTNQAAPLVERGHPAGEAWASGRSRSGSSTPPTGAARRCRCGGDAPGLLVPS